MKAILLPVCFLGLLSVALADDDPRPTVNSMSAAVSKAMMNKDVAGFASALRPIVTSDFKYYDTETAKPMAFDQMVAGMKQGFAAFTSMMTADSKILSVKKNADGSYRILMTHRLSGHVPGAGKKPHTLTFKGVSTDIYKKVGGAWKMSSMTWKSQEQFMDGRAVKMGG